MVGCLPSGYRGSSDLRQMTLQVSTEAAGVGTEGSWIPAFPPYVTHSSSAGLPVTAERSVLT